MSFGRRGLVGIALAAGAMVKAKAAWLSTPAHATDGDSGPITLPQLPWDESSLEPAISARTVTYHYGKIHRGYVQTTNAMIAGTPYADMPLVEIVQKSAADPAQKQLFNNAAQIWNHDFYWRSLTPKSGGQPGAQLSAMLVDGFGSFSQFHDQFLASADGQFGSGWLWLVMERSTKKLRLVKSANADTPVTGKIYAPLAVIDVWEHAYYLDYQNRRDEYADAVLAKLMNWKFVEKNLEAV